MLTDAGRIVEVGGVNGSDDDEDFCNDANQQQVDPINHTPTSCSKGFVQPEPPDL